MFRYLKIKVSVFSMYLNQFLTGEFDAMHYFFDQIGPRHSRHIPILLRAGVRSKNLRGHTQTDRNEPKTVHGHPLLNHIQDTDYEREYWQF